MNNKIKGIILIVISIVIGGVGYILMEKESSFFLFAFTVALIVLIVGIKMFAQTSNPNGVYAAKIKGIINTYDSILVKSNTVPTLEGRNIVNVSSMEDLVDAQLEIRKPICYLKQTESCSFILLDEKEAYIYTEKLNDKVLSPVEIEINEAQLKEKNKDEIDSEMIRNLEKTTIIKLSNQKSYKVSPIRKKQVDQLEEIEIL